MTATKHKYLTTGRLGKMLGVGTLTVTKWADAGLLRSHRLPGRLGERRIARADALAFALSRGIPVPPELGPHGTLAVGVRADALPLADRAGTLAEACYLLGQRGFAVVAAGSPGLSLAELRELALLVASRAAGTRLVAVLPEDAASEGVPGASAVLCLATAEAINAAVAGLP